MTPTNVRAIAIASSDRCHTTPKQWFTPAAWRLSFPSTLAARTAGIEIYFLLCSWLIGSFVFDACVFVSTLSGIRLKALSWPCAKSHWSGCNQRPKPRSDWGQSWTFPKASCHTVHMLDSDSVIAKTKKNTMRPKSKTIHGEDKSNSKRLNSNDNGIHYNL